MMFKCLAIQNLIRRNKNKELEENRNPKLYKIIKSFEKITGIGGLLNTSFNLHGEPIVNSPDDALHTLANSDLDMLYFNDDLLVVRK